MTLFEERVLNNKKFYLYKNKIKKPEIDKREYRLVRLENQLEILIISDEEADLAGCSMDVFVGSKNDFENLFGLAHFCEHLLFMGSSKYPVENDYDSFLSNNGGYSNAFTDYENTNYYFEVQADAFKGAIDRFAQFFITPLFSENSVDKEIKAVDSENKKNIQNDTWRIDQIIKSLAKKNHEYSRFSTGNIETLKQIPLANNIDIRKELIKFHDKYYSSNKMKLTMLGKESVEELIELAVSTFSEVKNKQIKVEDNKETELPYDRDCMMKHVMVVPIKEEIYVEYLFPMKSEFKEYEYHCLEYLSFLIGHEGTGSLFNLLKNENLATELYTYKYSDYLEFSMFALKIIVTPKGFENINRITRIVFQYIKLLREQKDKHQSLFEETQAIQQTTFRYKENITASDYTCELSALMQNPFVDRARLLCSKSVAFKYDLDVLMGYLSYLTPSNFLVVSVSQEYENSVGLLTEKWYGTKYKCESLDADFIEELKNIDLNHSLHLPSKNIFIPTEFNIVENEATDVPILLKETNCYKVWHKKDSFNVPKCHLFINIKSKLVYESAGNIVLTNLMVDLILECMNASLYQAQIAGLEYKLSASAYGIELIIKGYSHKLPVLLETISGYLKEAKFNQSKFNDIKESSIRKYKNFKVNSPYKHSLYNSSRTVLDKVWSQSEREKQIYSVTFEEVSEFHQLFIKDFYVESMFLGNIQKEKILHVFESFVHKFPIQSKNPENNIWYQKSLLFPKAHPNGLYHEEHVYNKEELNSAITYTLEMCDVTDISSRAYVDLLAYIAREPCFNQLRTIEQLGYIVSSFTSEFGSKYMFQIVIQSEKHAKYLEQRIKEFIKQLGETIKNKTTQEQYVEKIKALIKEKTKKKDNIYQEAKDIIKHFRNGFYTFDLEPRLVDALKSMTNSKEKFYEFYSNKVLNTQSKLSCHLLSHKCPSYENNDCGFLIDDIEQFKNSSSFQQR